jgi:hypothetical protein
MEMDMKIDMNMKMDEDVETWTRTWKKSSSFTKNIEHKMEVQAIFLKPFTVCTSCKQKFVVSPFVDEEKNWKLSVLQTDKTDLPFYNDKTV